MKKASIILSHLTNQPQFRFIKQQICYKKYIKLLGYKYQKAIAFVYIKNKTLFVAVTHPIFKMEFNYNQDLLKSVLSQLNRYDESCKQMKADKVVIFHSKYHPIEHKENIINTIPYYSELASSNFKIHSKDKEIIAKFEEIKEQIRCNK